MSAKKINTVMLVDDDKFTNAVNRRLINDSGICENIIVAENVLDAVKILALAGDEHHPQPSLIFLDLNMPELSGKDFLAVSHELSNNSLEPFVLIFLSSSTDEKAIEEISNTSVVQDFIKKPLTQEKLDAVVQKHFS